MKKTTLGIHHVTAIAGDRLLADRVYGATRMKVLAQTDQRVADLHWLAFLLTGCRETSVNVVIETIASQDDGHPFFSAWMHAWSRRLVIAKALAAIREDLVASALRTRSARVEGPGLPEPTWSLDRDATKLDLERALLTVDVFPRAAVLLSVFERMPLEDAAIVLDADAELVRKAQRIGLQELTRNLARMQGWTPDAPAPGVLRSEMQPA